MFYKYIMYFVSIYISDLLIFLHIAIFLLIYFLQLTLHILVLQIFLPLIFSFTIFPNRRRTFSSHNWTKWTTTPSHLCRSPTDESPPSVLRFHRNCSNRRLYSHRSWLRACPTSSPSPRPFRWYPSSSTPTPSSPSPSSSRRPPPPLTSLPLHILRWHSLLLQRSPHHLLRFQTCGHSLRQYFSK